MNIRCFFLSVVSFIGFCFLLSSCLGKNDVSANDYEDWRIENEEYIKNAATELSEGRLRYDKVVPDWDKSVYTLMEWIEHGNSNEGINPITNSTVKINYLLKNIEGDTLDYSTGFVCQPVNLVTGFQVALYNMVPGDSVQAIVPYEAGYGSYSYGSVLPYSTLVFGIRLDSIRSYQSLPWR